MLQIGIKSAFSEAVVREQQYAFVIFDGTDAFFLIPCL